jgi:hypothetical protein
VRTAPPVNSLELFDGEHIFNCSPAGAHLLKGTIMASSGELIRLITTSTTSP